MSAPIPLRRDFGASHLRTLARKTKDGPSRPSLSAATQDWLQRPVEADFPEIGDWLCRWLFCKCR